MNLFGCILHHLGNCSVNRPLFAGEGARLVVAGADDAIPRLGS